MSDQADQPALILVPPDPPVAQKRGRQVLALLEPTTEVRLDPKFVRSVAGFGVLAPIAISTTTNAAGLYHIIDGKRRVAALRELGVEEVETLAFDLPVEQAEVATLILNDQRSANLAAEVQALMKLRDRGFDEKQIATAMSVPIGKIRKKMKVLGLIPDLLDLLFIGQLQASIALLVCTWPPARQDHVLQRLRERGKLTMRDIADLREAARTSAQDAIEGLQDMADAIDGDFDEKALVPKAQATIVMMRALLLCDHRGIDVERRLEDVAGQLRHALDHIRDNYARGDDVMQRIIGRAIDQFTEAENAEVM